MVLDGRFSILTGSRTSARESDLQINKRSSWWKNSSKGIIILEERLIASLARSMLTVVDSRGTFATSTEIHFLQVSIV